MHLMFLGTGAMVPTKERNVSSVLLEYKGEFILFDCGEGTQRQMNLVGYNRTKVTKVLLTHWHGDHVSGLIGLIQTIGNIPNPGELVIIGPRGTKQFMYHLTHSAVFDPRLKLTIIECYPQSGPEVVYEAADYCIEAVAVEHSIDCVAFSFVEKTVRRMDLDKASSCGLRPGKEMGVLTRGGSVEYNGTTITPEMVTYEQVGRKISYIMDTSLCESAIALARNSDVCICESTFSSDTHQDKAEQYGHMSARDAALIARSANASSLIITHFSQRYPSSTPLLEEALDTFPSTVAAYDFMRFDISKK